MIELIIADKSKKFTHLTEEKITALADVRVTASVTDIGKLDSVLSKNKASVLLVGPSHAKKSALKKIADICADFPNVSILLIANSLSTDLLREAMHSGVKDVLLASSETKDVIVAIERADMISQQIKSALKIKNKELDDEASPTDGKAEVLSVIGTKGGIGKSFIASNLALCLANGTKKKVILVDLDLSFGDVCVMLKLFPKHTMTDVIEDIDRLDAEMMKGFLTRHSSGLSVLASPIDPDQAGNVVEEQVEKIIQILREMADYVVIDTAPSVNGHVSKVLEASSEVFIVTSMDVPSIKNTKLAIKAVETIRNGQNGQNTHLILNRSDSKVGLNCKQIEEALETPVYASVPSCRRVPLSINKGVPVVFEYPRSAVSKSIDNLAEMVLNNSAYEENLYEEEAEN